MAEKEGARCWEAGGDRSRQERQPTDHNQPRGTEAPGTQGSEAASGTGALRGGVGLPVVD